EGREEGRGVVPLGKEEGSEERRQGRVEVEVIPLEDRAQRGGEDDLALLLARDLEDGGVGIRGRYTHESSFSGRTVRTGRPDIGPGADCAAWSCRGRSSCRRASGSSCGR